VAQVGIKELLVAGVHFGHQTRRWNPKMRRFIFGERGGIHIIDLQQTEKLLAKAQEFTAEVASRGGTVLFVGTKKQARDAVRDAATNAGMPYVNQRWLGGLLTNFQTINRRIRRLHQLTEWTEDGTLELLPTRERIKAIKEREKLEINLGGVRNMQRPPDAVFVIDLKTEAIAVAEARRLRIPIIGLVDTNVDPDPVTFPIPGNDDAIRSCKVIVDAIGDVAAERAAQFRAEEEAARREREEQERIEAEARAKREAEERERREAAEKAAAEAAAAQAAAAAAAAAQAAQDAPAEAQQPAQAEAPQAAQPEAPAEPVQAAAPEPPAAPAEETPAEATPAAEEAPAAEEPAAAEEAPAEEQPEAAAEEAAPAEEVSK
jgi:small subunit ribosomal protein S2